MPITFLTNEDKNILDGQINKNSEDIGRLSEEIANIETESGVYVGNEEPTDPSVNVWIDLDGEPDGEIPEPYVLPVASADTLGGVRIGKGLQMDGDVLSGIGAVNIELIWENANPASGFAEQAIPLDLSRAKVIFLQAQNNVTGGGYLLSYGPFPKNETCIIERNVETNVFTRKFTATDAGVYFLNANMGAYYLVPLKIWAIFE
jgi:hypothetical protein